MEENEIMQPAESAPQEDAESTATAAAEPTTEEAKALGTTPDAESTEDVQQPITIPIQFNHESRELSLEEAQSLAQKGLKFEELSPTLEKIRFLAAANGKSMQEMVDAWRKARTSSFINLSLRSATETRRLQTGFLMLKSSSAKPPLKVRKRKQQPRRKKKRPTLPKGWPMSSWSCSRNFPN